MDIIKQDQNIDKIEDTQKKDQFMYRLTEDQEEFQKISQNEGSSTARDLPKQEFLDLNQQQIVKMKESIVFQLTDAAELEQKLKKIKENEKLCQLLDIIGLIDASEGQLSAEQKIKLATQRFTKLKDSNSFKELINGKMKKQFQKTEQNEQKITKKGIIKSPSFQEPSIIVRNKNQNGRQTSKQKKVQITEPFTSQVLEKYKFKMQQQLLLHLKKLCMGFVMKKYCFGLQKVQKVKIFFSFDLKYVFWQQIATKKIKIKSMLDFRTLSSGIKSKLMKYYIKRKYVIDQSLVISLIFNERSLDLQALNEADYKNFVQSFKYVRSFV